VSGVPVMASATMSHARQVHQDDPERPAAAPPRGRQDAVPPLPAHRGKPLGLPGPELLRWPVPVPQVQEAAAPLDGARHQEENMREMTGGASPEIWRLAEKVLAVLRDAVPGQMATASVRARIADGDQVISREAVYSALCHLSETGQAKKIAPGTWKAIVRPNARSQSGEQDLRLSSKETVTLANWLREPAGTLTVGATEFRVLEDRSVVIRSRVAPPAPGPGEETLTEAIRFVMGRYHPVGIATRQVIDELKPLGWTGLSSVEVRHALGNEARAGRVIEDEPDLWRLAEASGQR
jgi:hypothetical protein